VNPIPLTFAGLGKGIPNTIVTNHQLAETLDTTDEWITARTGIKCRRVLDEDQALSSLAIAAGREALEASGIEPSEIDLVIVATLTPDTFMPATACRVADALGCDKAGAFDLNIACSGFLYGVLTAVSQMESRLARNVLLIGGDTLSRITDWTDRRTAVLFGDCAGAAVLTRAGEGRLLGFDYGADGTLGEALQIKAGPSNPSTVPSDYKVTMDGRAVFRFATGVLAKSCQATLDKAGLGIESVDLIIPHQANLRIIESAAKKMSCPIEKFFINLERYGNTSAGSIPVALAEAHDSGRLMPGSKVMLAGFGGGLSWGSVLLHWG
jgi:3-oxoacyl-[acyl-carrier-protein] synthase III